MTDGGDQFPNRAVQQQRSALPVQFPVVPMCRSLPRRAMGTSDPPLFVAFRFASHPSSSRRPRYLFSRLGHVFCEGHEKCVCPWFSSHGGVVQSRCRQGDWMAFCTGSEEITKQQQSFQLRTLLLYTGFGHRFLTGNGESAALNCAAHSANYSISCGHLMAEPGTLG